MKKKLLVVLLAIISVFAIAFGLTACGGNNTEDGGVKHTHSYTESIVEPTCTEGGYTIYTCTCGHSYQDNVTPATGHSFAEEWTYDATYHWHVSTCGHTDEVSGKAEHNFDNGVVTTPATHTTDGLKTYTCTDCGYERTETIPAESEAHTYAPEWTYDATYHWHASTCVHTDEVSGKAEHTWENGYCSVCGKKDLSVPSEGLRFTLSSDETYYSVEGIGTCKDIELVIPSTYNDKPVTSIGTDAFRQCISMTSITIPDSVTSIGTDAFMHCSSLTSITIPDSVTSIGGGVFYSCSSLTSITIPDSVTSIGKRAFYNCSGLTSITIPDSVTSIGESTFSGCSSLANIQVLGYTYVGSTAFGNVGGNITFEKYNQAAPVWSTSWNDGFKGTVTYSAEETSQPSYTQGLSFELQSDKTYSVSVYNGSETEVIIPELYQGLWVTSIGYAAFEDCSSLTSITIPDSVTSIGDRAFKGCSSLTSVTIPDIVTSIGSYAFYSCSSLTSVTIPDSVTLIGDLAFYNCSGLTSVTIGNGVMSIGSEAFENCSSLTSVTIPDSVTTIGSRAFFGCIKLTKIEVDANNQSYKSIDGDLYTKDGNTLIQYAIDKTAETFEIPDSVTSIGDYAFYNCSGLTCVTIPDSVTSIGFGAFYNCKNLTEINYNATECVDLSSSNYVFYKAGQDGTGITVTFGANVEKIPAYLFYPYSSSSYAPKITSVVFEEGGVCESIGSCAFYKCSGLTSITIPYSVTSIGGGAFFDCSSLTNVTIPDSVTSIGSSAFNGCSSLESVTIGNGVTAISDYAFNNCNSLTSVTIPDSVTTIGSYAFLGCSSLTSITIPDSVISIDWYAFCGCSSLTSVTIGSSVTSIGSKAFENCSSLTSITIPDSVTSIGYSTFRYCSSLTSVTIGNSVTSIGNDAFNDCSSLTSVTIPDSVTIIGDRAFYGCSNLTSIVIPDSVTSIGYFAFRNCRSLTSVTFKNTSGWWYSSSSTATRGTSISSYALADASTAAKYLKSTYYNYYWKRS